MTNVNDDKLHEDFGEQRQKGDSGGQKSKQKGSQVQRQGGQEFPFLSEVGPDLTIPYESFSLGNQLQQQGEEEPALFGQSQFEGGLGPVYAVPSVPWQNGVSPGGGPWHAHGQGPGIGHWQQWGYHPPAMMPYCGCCRMRWGYYM